MLGFFDNWRQTNETFFETKCPYGANNKNRSEIDYERSAKDYRMPKSQVFNLTCFETHQNHAVSGVMLI